MKRDPDVCGASAPCVDSYTPLGRLVLGFCWRALLLGALALVVGCAEDAPVEPRGPVASQRPHTIHAHGESRADEYHWLRDDSRSAPEVQALIAAENAYTNLQLAPLEVLIRGLHDEIARRYSADSTSVPVRIGGWQYSREFRAGGERPVYVRTRDGESQVLLDVNELGTGYQHYRVENWAVSPSGDFVAFLEDRTGERRHVLRIRDLTTGRYLPGEVRDAADTLAWADNNTLVHVGLDAAGRAVRVLRMAREGKPALVHTERKPGVTLAVLAERDGNGVLVRRRGPGVDELARVGPAGLMPLVVTDGRHRYRLRQGGEQSFLLSDRAHPDYALMAAGPANLQTPAAWRELYRPAPGARLVDFEVFADFVVALEKSVSARRLWVMDRRTGRSQDYLLGQATDAVALMGNPDYSARVARYRVSSLISPEQTRSIDLETGQVTRLATRAVNGFVPGRYTTRVIETPARDGANVPVTLAWRSDLFRHGLNPLYLIVYGAYGVTLEANFRPELISLLDRGFVVAIAHVRGSQAQGRAWHESGRGMHKRNTFDDLLDARAGLLERGYGHPERVFVRGSSAGGLVVGYLANEAPRDFAGVIAERPFVDLLTTLEDASLPLSGSERAEWGNPGEPAVFQFLKGISPYDQLRRQAYPAVFATAALQDTSVGYYEALKWVQRMRRMQTGPAPILIDIDMSAGHSGSTEIWRRHNATAREFAFMLGILCRTRSVCLRPNANNES